MVLHLSEDHLADSAQNGWTPGFCEEVCIKAALGWFSLSEIQPWFGT
jgi:hypothetical protein